jgi:sugar lactone lactonase YvrE
MSEHPWEVVVDGLGRLEGPCIDLEGNLCFSDAAGDGTIYRVGGGREVETLVEGRPHVGGMVAHVDGGFVASGHTVSVINAGSERVVMDSGDAWGFNDLTTDLEGNVFVGLHVERPTAEPPSIEASLWRISTSGETSLCYGGIQQTNGLGISPDGTLLFHNDTLPQVVWVSDIGDDGLPVNRRVFHQVEHGMPDGMAIDEEGGVWVAVVGSGQVLRITPDGKADLVFDVPMPFVTSLCFGGSDRCDLYATTFGEPFDKVHSGSIICTRSPVPGFATPLARL